MRLPFSQIDAFASRAFEGNPAAVMPLAAWLDDAVLQNIAAENNLSETAFIVASADDEADFDLRWFTPAAEVVLCGHATLASGHFVLSSEPARDRVRFRTRKAGMLEVARAGAGYELALPAWEPAPKPLPEIVAALGLNDAVETLWHPNRYGLVVVETAEQIRALDPDFRALAREGDVLTIVTAPGEDSDIISRVFACGAGIDEDPVTGSAHAVMVPYWAKRLGRDSFTAYQASKRGGRLTCRLAGDRVVLGGSCVTVLEGTFLLD
ncbi:PhzF family phenazine biosynthesis protein [Sphingomonas sp.]|jgi:PhzF family phenazine biosynthesis protein|uniref:PhzF family phenazine biosynthesis protein n=1 Tax=Sphingomonas sp. TaxID=28214 RepID=UPI002E310AE2|nr:PhzF family phenazine biosynthesis protein [Sphingomonas sp.]HEX4695647.1 PhzF family phenazine biosynthesis protein [Sphingomonas sp.]